MAAEKDEEGGNLFPGGPEYLQDLHPVVTFTRPDLGGIREEGYTTVDMHFHTIHTDGLVGIRTSSRRSGPEGSAAPSRTITRVAIR